MPEIPSAPVSEAAPAEPAVTPAAIEPVPAPEPAAPKYVVFLPERVDSILCWYYYTDVRQYFVQSAVEKGLINSGKELIDLSISDAFQAGGSITEVTNPAEAIKKAAALGAAYAVIGQANAVKAGEAVAYGTPVVRANADASARIIRVKDGKMLASEDATVSQVGGGSSQAATQAALKQVGQMLASKLVAAAARAETAP